MKVAPERISVVVQGPLLRGEPRGITACLASVRRVLPGAEIVVSTWEGEDTTGLGADAVVTSADPGGWPDLWGFGYNLVRQLVSTRAGLALARRDYILKLRADLELESDALCLHLPRKPGALLDAPVVMSNLFVRDPERMPMLFHVSDIAMFGTAQDMRELWASSPPTKTTLWVEDGINILSSPFHLSRQRQCPEQYLVIDWLRRRGYDVWLNHPTDLPRGAAALWSEVLWRNFEVFDAHACGVSFPERFSKAVLNQRTLLRRERFLALEHRPFSSWVMWANRLNPACPMLLHRSWGTGMKVLARMPEGVQRPLWEVLRRVKRLVLRALGRAPEIAGKY